MFCASLADVFEDRPDLDAPRQRLFDLIAQAPNLDWLLLTKRPEVARDWLKGSLADSTGNVHAGSWPWPNVWLGTSVEDQDAARKRIPILLDIPAAIHFLSCEPQLGPLDISDWLYFHHTRTNKVRPYGRIEWVITGGESGGGSRPYAVEWARSLIDQCKTARVACFVKQMGANVAPLQVSNGSVIERLFLADKKGGNWDEWPADLRVREFPKAVTT